MTTTAADIWTVVRVGEALARAEQQHLAMLRLLDRNARVTMPERARWTLGTSALAQMRELLHEQATTMELLHSLAADFPAEEVHATYPQLRDGAAGDLASGILDPDRALLAARALDTGTGWAALADALCAIDVRTLWPRLTLGELLGAFRGADRHAVRRILTEAGLTPDDAFANCPPAKLARLASVLRNFTAST